MTADELQLVQMSDKDFRQAMRYLGHHDIDPNELRQYLNGKRIFPFKSQKIGRNDPCPCGSGKKYKKCCA